AAGWDATVTCAPPPTCPAPSNLLVNGTTDTTATLSWTPGLSETAWEVLVQPAGAGAPTAGSTGIPAGTNTNFLVNPPLTPATNYEYWVRAVCSASDNSIWVGPKTFTTLCSVINVPFQEGFNSTSPTEQCWTVVNANGDADAWDMNYATNPFEGNQAAMLYTDFNAGANNDWLISPVLNLSATPGPKRLKFHYRVQSAGEPNDFRVVLSTTGPATANFTETLVPLTSYSNIAYEQKIVNLIGPGNVPYTGNVNIAFHVPAGGLDGWRLYIDNVIIEDMPACPDPSNLVVNATTQTTATLSWTPGFTETAWEVAVQAPGAGMPPTGSTTIYPAGTNTNFVVGPLNPSTNYEYWVRAICNATDQSAWIGPIPFSTTQIPATMNFSDNFEGPSGFTLVNGTQTNKWVIGTAVNNGGTSCLYISNNNGVSNAYTNTATTTVHAYRDIAVPAGVTLMNLSFDWRAQAESCCDYIRAWIVPTSYTPTPGTLVAGAAPAFLQLSPNLNNQAGFSTVSYDIPGANYTGQTIRLVFEWRNDGSVGTNPPGAIDNINFSVVTCPKPTALAVSAVTEGSATVSWTAGAGETEWELVVQPLNSGVPTGASTIIPVTGTPSYTFPPGSLSPNTNYEYYVRAVCSPTDSSLWAGPRPFTTTQIPAIVNYVEDFESTPAWTLNNGTQTNKWIIGTATSNGGAQSLYISNNNSANAYTNSSTSVVHAYRDILIPAGTNLMNLSFDWKAVGESCCDYLSVWTVPATFSPVAGTQITAAASNGQQLNAANMNQQSAWTTQSYELTAGAYAGNIMRLVFEWRNDSSVGTNPPAAIDNINLTIPTCPEPYNLASSGQSGSPIVTLSWTPGGSETQWEVVVQTQGLGLPNGASTIIPVFGAPVYNYSGVNGVFYEYYVRAVCSSSDSSEWAGPFVFAIYAPPGCASVDVVGVGIDVVNNQVLLCPDQAAQDVQLSASYFGIGATTSYDVSSIDYNPPFPFTGGTQVSVGTDDVWSPVVNLPFNFCFFGNSYSTARVGSNGVVAFGVPAATTYCPWSFSTTIPNTGFPILNAIYGVYQDVDPSINPIASGTTVNYQVLGSYPCRALVVNFTNINQFSCGTATGPQTSQVVMYEISNIIEVYVQRRVPCVGWQSGVGVIGIQNAAGTVAYTPPGRNTGAWSATNEAWRFTPNAPATIDLAWIQNGTVIGTDNTVTVSVSDDTVVTAQATYTQCDGSTVVKTSDIQIVVTEELPTLVPHDMFACSNDANPTFDLTQNGDYVLSESISTNYNVTYYTSEAAAIAAVPGTEIPNPTTYSGTDGETIWMNITSNANCTVIKSFTLSFSTSVPDYTLTGITGGGVTVCNGDTATITVTPNNFNGATAFYEWVDPNGDVIAETSGTLTLPAGALPGTYVVTVDTGCKTTQTFNVSVVQITATVPMVTASCNPSVGTLVVTGSGGTDYEYSFDGGLTFQTDNTYTNVPGTYPVVIRDTTTGCVSAVEDGIINPFVGAPVAPTLALPVDQTCSSNGEIHVTAPSNGPVTYSNLFISEVIDSNAGSLSYVEIYNGTGTSVNLSGYKLKFYTTMGSPSCDFTLVGTLANGATHIVKVSNDANFPGVVPNQSVTTCSGVNIDDRIHLTTSTGSQSIIDVWGTPDGSVFTPGGQPGYTYRRNNTAIIPSGTWNPADWTAIDPEDYTDLGSFVPAITNFYYSLDGGTPQASPDFTDVAPGDHVVTVVDMNSGCISPGTSITIGAAQQPAIAYASPFCQGAGTVNPTSQTGEVNGVYSSTAGLIIDPVTGAIDLDASTPGMYTVAYAITGSINCTPATFDIVINANITPVTDFSYTTPVCILTGGTLLPTGIPGFTAGGQYSAPAGLSINSTTGAINVANSAAGTYTVTYTIAANLCNPGNASTFDVTIDPATDPVVAFSYTDICTGGANQLPALAAGFVTGGTFTSTAGLSIDAVTGEINVANSDSGTYTVQYHINEDAAICQNEADHTATITIIDGADVVFEQGCEGVNYMITAVPVDGSFNPSQVSYSWTGPNGFTATTQSVVATTMGTYTVVITTSEGCSSTVSESITPESCLIPKGISPNNDGSNDNFDLEGMNVRHLSIFNRYGTTVYEHGAGYTNQWHGQSKNGNE
ncbi:choice-of-anchor J domain-containing protein, partial [Flavobacterium suncheonense]|uniref:choice-of-anchor J domain-containing protein n=1 Tax=Flavobacterium suncheonense TaxID=350894 RepID=UPI003FA3D22C